jgi:hypothetical protein
MNTYCALNTDPQEDVHMNMQAGTWPIASLSPTTGELVITNTRKCSCGQDEGRTVFYLG